MDTVSLDNLLSNTLDTGYRSPLNDSNTSLPAFSEDSLHMLEL